ncbi:unnamed protein product [Schistocephalus solidus]|uniref:DDE_Tnp_1_7 domain-containing protein n=1 Tax=Schistocephalus solidus TaxID=70667 RepID=A0A183T341_SCHSO|nr:unnamed protein product [Schistocephalus solidus]
MQCIVVKSASTRIYEHQLAVKRQDHLSQTAMHTLDTGHTFAWDTTRIVAACPFKKGREFLKAMHSDESCINRHIELDAANRHLKKKWKKREPIRTGSCTRRPLNGANNHASIDLFSRDYDVNCFCHICCPPAFDENPENQC